MAHLSGIEVGKHARVLAAALVLGAAVLSLSAGQAEARPRRPADNGVRCWLPGGGSGRADGYWEAFLPGDIVTDQATGKRYRCGGDGKWHPARIADDTVLTPPGADGGVLAPTP
jgi:hypothetical protein